MGTLNKQTVTENMGVLNTDPLTSGGGCSGNTTRQSAKDVFQGIIDQAEQRLESLKKIKAGIDWDNLHSDNEESLRDLFSKIRFGLL